jgi:protein-disulfide isomerase
MCIGLYAVNLLLLFYTWIIQKRFSDSGLIQGTKKDIGFLWNNKLRFLPPLAAILLSVVLAMVFYPQYWSFQPPPLRADIPKGITADGHPWIGAQDPVLEITEFADYQCFQCKKMHFFLRRLVNENSEKIRIVHRHYPMDHEFNPIVKEPFHVGSGKLALLAIYATSKNKFWEMNDLLYSHAGQKQPLRIKDLADEAGLDVNEMIRAITDRAVRYRLQRDIVAGIKLGISGTPAYLIEGELYLGQIPPEVVRSAIK